MWDEVPSYMEMGVILDLLPTTTLPQYGLVSLSQEVTGRTFQLAVDTAAYNLVSLYVITPFRPNYLEASDYYYGCNACGIPCPLTI